MENIQEEIKVQEQQPIEVQSPAVIVGDSSEEQGQRGKYRQYEDPLALIEKIRFYRTQRFPDSEIMKRLGNMPRRTYYKLCEKASGAGQGNNGGMGDAKRRAGGRGLCCL